jgi:hypothetical protein
MNGLGRITSFGGDGGGEVIVPVDTIAGLSATGSCVSGHCSSRIIFDWLIIHLDSRAFRCTSNVRGSEGVSIAVEPSADSECTVDDGGADNECDGCGCEGT